MKKPRKKPDSSITLKHHISVCTKDRDNLSNSIAALSENSMILLLDAVSRNNDEKRRTDLPGDFEFWTIPEPIVIDNFYKSAKSAFWRIFKYAKEIHQYIINRKQFIDFYLSENYTEASDVLESIKNDTGLSFWYIRNRITLDSALNQKNEYLEKVNAECVNPRIQAFISYVTLFVKMSLDRSKPTDRISAILTSNFESNEYDPEFRFILQTFITCSPNIGEANFTTLINYSQIFPVIDQYEIVIDALLKFKDALEEGKTNKLIAELNALRTVIPSDTRLDAVSDWYTSSGDSEIDSRFRCEQNSIKEVIFTQISQYITGSYTEDSNDISKIPLLESFRRAVISEEQSKYSESEITRAKWMFPNDALPASIFKLMEIELFRYSGSTDKDWIWYLQEILKVLQREDQVTSNEVECLISGVEYLRNGNPEKALAILENLASSKSLWIRRVGTRMTVEACMRNKQIELATIKSVDFLIEAVNEARKFPLLEILQKNTYNQDANRDIHFPIFYRLCSMTSDSSLGDPISNSAEDYLLSIGVTFPSDIRPTIGEHRLVVFFLKEICSENYMDRWPIFKSMTELQQERIRILEHLTILDGVNKPQYETEMREILRKQEIAKRIKSIEKTKIFVDLESVREECIKKLEEPFQRFLLLRKNPIADKVSPSFQKSQVKESDQKRVASISENESFSIYRQMMSDMVYEYLFSPKHGLDGYVSVRIRHGVLAGHLRQPFDTDQLLIGIGEPNFNNIPERWKYAFHDANNDEKVRIATAFSELSNNFSSLINTINNNWLQVRVANDHLGLFNFYLVISDFEQAAIQMSKVESLESFVSNTLNLLSALLSKSLEDIRYNIELSAKEDLRAMLRKFQSSILCINIGGGYAEISNATMRAMTNVDTAISRILTWFQMPPVESNEIFRIEDVVNVSTAMIQRVNPQFAIELKSTESDLSIVSNFSSFCDIFQILFINIINHSGITPPPKANIDISSSSDSIKIVVENEVSDILVCPANSEKLESIRTKISEEPYTPNVRIEGGSGLHKLNKLLSHDIAKCTCNIDFGIQNGRFFVSMIIPLTIGEMHG